MLSLYRWTKIKFGGIIHVWFTNTETEYHIWRMKWDRNIISIVPQPPIVGLHQHTSNRLWQILTKDGVNIVVRRRYLEVTHTVQSDSNHFQTETQSSFKHIEFNQCLGNVLIDFISFFRNNKLLNTFFSTRGRQTPHESRDIVPVTLLACGWRTWSEMLRTSLSG